MTLRRAWLLLVFLACIVSAPSPSPAAELPVDQLPDLGGSASPIVTLISRDNFDNEFRYEVSVQNHGAEPIASGSLVLVLDQITDLAGKDALDRIDVLGQDGQTADGKPYFRIRAGAGDVAPYAESPPATVRLRNSAYTIIFTPSFRVRGLRRTPVPQLSETVQRLIETLERKGVLDR